MFYINPNAVFTRGKNLPFEEKIDILKHQLATANAVVLGAGSGLSTAAGYVYSGERFKKYFADFETKYGFHDMYSGGFYPYETLEEFWGFWCRYIWINRYAPIPSNLYDRIFELVCDKDYFVLTTNVDHCFQRAGFDKSRLFYTQGDYGLFQSSAPNGKSAKKTYDNYETIKKMVLSEGFMIDENNEFSSSVIARSGSDEAISKIKMSVPQDLLPICPDDGKPMTTNLRSDDTFVEDSGWHRAAQNYENFLAKHEKSHVLFLELGVGMNTPGIIKFPFWEFTLQNKNAFYACVNFGEAGCAENIVNRSVCIDAGIGEVVDELEK